ncbi:MAG TPA: PIN domain-containing protein [Acidimicrobiales bacterium]|nr:PIN domain-containing protein [Acidimicrobiales bacterium]
MFVEITRLIIVFLTTAGGFTLAKQARGDHAILGATLGAALGYVAGGILGRLLRQAMGVAERRLDQSSPARLLAGTFGAVGAGGIALLLGFPLIALVPRVIGWPALMLVVWVGMYTGGAFAGHKAEGLLAMAGLSTRPLVRASPYGEVLEEGATLLDTSAVIDGRLLALARAGFMKGAVLVPRFVLDELQAIADAQDPVRRRRGRRGLDLLDALQHTPGLGVHVVDDEVLEHEEVDAKLVALARRLQVQLLTVDSPLQRVAELQGVHCLNVDSLSEGLRKVHLPGETLRLPITREGKEPGQGVGFLDDGTMVVVGDAAPLVGQEIDVRVTGNVQTSVGRMLFASMAPGD